ncbi:MAG: ATP-binding protein [Lachnospiraceae bacterium]
MGNTIPDIPRVYTAIAEWSACLIFIVTLKARFEKKKMILLSAAVLTVLVVFLEATATTPLWLWLPCMLVAFLIMAGYLYGCTEISWWDCFYYATLAFVIAECVASLEWQVVSFFFTDMSAVSPWIQGLILFGVYAPVELIIWSLIRSHIPADGHLDISRKDWFTALFIGLVVFGFSNLSFVTTDTPFSGEYYREIANMRTLVDIAGVAMLYAHLVLCCENKVRMELEAVQNVLQNQYQQYKLSRESIDLINYKYHDLKHQIAVLRRESDPEKRNAFLNQMEEEIKQYELQNKTGNSVLDTVLTSKSLYCNKHGITLTSVVDGKLLEFMDTMDICSIFGNALDNAIESVLKISNKEKRLIHVTVLQQKNFLMIRIENYYEGGVEFEKGNPASTKKNKQFHGYGIKSIRYTVNKYDGAVYIDTENQWFDLKILIPLRG